MRKYIAMILLLLCLQFTHAQTAPRQVNAVRTVLPIKIDGELKDEAWKSAPLITGLIEQRPTFGRAENESSKSEVYLLYDDNAIYFGGFLHEPKDSISTELAGRD
ncbi:MAG TPA: hypothetical protein VD996_15865, partial [Chitinophagaceae bacterium]|nr:hypothetical protein [Chitinophagaceae bacterium]